MESAPDMVTNEAGLGLPATTEVTTSVVDFTADVDPAQVAIEVASC